MAATVRADTAFTLEADSYAGPVAIRDFTRHWRGDYQGGSDAFLQGRAELTRRDDRQEFALLWRYDYLLSFPPATADLYHRYATGRPPVTGSAYPVAITARYAEAGGARWSPVLHIGPDIRIMPGINLLKGYKLTDGTVDGSVVFQGAGFGGRDVGSAGLGVDYHYDEPQLYEDRLGWHPRNPQGEGASLDLRADWTPDQRRRVSLQLYDVYGLIRWRDVPSTRYRFRYTSNPQDHALDGQLQVDSRFDQRLWMRGSLSARYEWPSGWQAGARLDANRDVMLAQVAGGYRAGAWTGRLLWEPGTGALGAEIVHPCLTLRWLADSLNTNRARRLGVTLAASVPW